MKKNRFTLFALAVIAAVLLLVALAPAAPFPTAQATTNVPDGLTVADWAQIKSQLAPQTIADFTQQAKLTASDAAPFDYFGWSVAVSGDTAVVGAPYDDTQRGSAYVFTRSGGIWSEQAKLTASDAADHDHFGYSVAVSDDIAVVGAPYDDDAGNSSGSAYVFARSGGIWSQQAKLTASDAAAHDLFGWSVAVSGDTAIVGAPDADDGAGWPTGWGAAYVFTRSGGLWSQEAKLTPSDIVYRFGLSVAISGDTAVLGTPGDHNGGESSGAAYVFTRSGGIWSEQAKLKASDAAAFDIFGWSVAVSGDTAVIGAYGDDDGGNDSGSAYVFARSGGVWSEQAKLTASDPAAFDNFGWSVAVSGDTAVVGAPFANNGAAVDSGSVYAFTRSGGIWSEQTKLTVSPPGAHNLFGHSVAISGDTTIVGEHGDDASGFDSGAAYVFAPSYLLTVSASGMGSGNIVSNPSGIDCGLNCDAPFAVDTVVTLTATAEMSSTFTGWSGAILTTTNPITLTMDSAKAITATFALNQYTITLSAEPAEGGTVAGGGSVAHGQEVTVTATAETDYTFLHWTEGGDVVSTEASYSFTAAADRALVAHFMANAVYGFSLSPTTAVQSADPDTTVTYTLSLTNTGNAADVVSFSVAGNSWAVELPAPVALGVGASAQVEIAVTVPANSAGGATDNAIVTATSTGNPNATATSTLTTSANNLYGVILASVTAEQNANRGETITYTLTITNSGNSTDSFGFTANGNTWPVAMPTPITLAMGETAQVAVAITVPANATGGETDSVTITATSVGQPSETASTALTTSVNYLFGVTMTAEMAAQSASPGHTVVYSVMLTNSGEATDTFTLAATTNDWPTSLPSSISLAAGATESFVVEVVVPVTASQGEVDSVLVVATSSNDAEATATVTLTTTARVGVVLVPGLNGTAITTTVGSDAVYEMQLINNSDITHTFGVTVTGASWETVVALADVGDARRIDAEALSVTLGPGEAATLRVTVVVPDDAVAGSVDTALITATARDDATVTHSLSIVTTAVVDTTAPSGNYIYLPMVIRP